MARSVVATDNFNRATLGADWAQLRPFDGSIIITANQMAVEFLGAARWVGAGTFTNDQYSSLVLATLDFGGAELIGVLVRASGDIDGARDYYSYFDKEDVGGDLAQLTKVVNGTETILDSRASTFVAGDRIELEVEGTTLRGMRNGVVLVTVTDSALATGKPGVMNDLTGQVFGDNWEGGNISEGGARALDTGFWRVQRAPAARTTVSVW